jgi:phage shock protein A
MLAKGSQVWEQLTPSPNMASNGGSYRGSAAASEAQVQALQALVADLEKRVAALEGELAAGRAESAALKARIEDLASRQAELRRLLAGGSRRGSELAGAEKSRVIHP